MIVYCLLGITLLLAFVSLLAVVRAGRLSLGHSWHYLLVAVSLAGFIYLYGTWVFISVYCKYVFAVCFLVAAVIGLLRKKKGSAMTVKKRTVGLNMALASILVGLVILYFTGTAGKPYGVINLALPFKTGTYFVFQGGEGLPTNIFHYGGRHTLYAMDIIKLNRAGNRAKHIFSSKLGDYEIFGDTIYSPCNAVVLKTEHGNPDNIPPSRKRGPTNLNHVLLETGSAYIFLGHLEKGAVFVKEGDVVAIGQPLGLAGNSGASLEPHLHIQAHAKTSKDVPWYEQPQLLIKFNGKSYLLFDEILTEKTNWPLPNPNSQ